MTKHRGITRVQCVDCGASRLLDESDTSPLALLECTVCANKPKASPDHVLVHCMVCHGHVEMPKDSVRDTPCSCWERSKATPDLVIAECDVCHARITISEEHRSKVRCNRLWMESHDSRTRLCSGIFRDPLLYTTLKPFERRQAGQR